MPRDEGSSAFRRVMNEVAPLPIKAKWKLPSPPAFSSAPVADTLIKPEIVRSLPTQTAAEEFNKAQEEERKRILDSTRITITEDELNHVKKFIALVAITGGETGKTEVGQNDISQREIYLNQGILPQGLDGDAPAVGEDERSLQEKIEAVAAKITAENIKAFYKRLIEKRPKMFMLSNDSAVISRKNPSGAEILHKINGVINLTEYVGYSEMEFGAMLQVFGATQFINDGDRNNRGATLDEPDTYGFYVNKAHEKSGYISAITGMRFETRDPAMEKLHVIPGKRKEALDSYLKLKGFRDKGTFARMEGVTEDFVEGHELIWGDFYRAGKGSQDVVASASSSSSSASNFDEKAAEYRLYLSYKKFLAESIANVKQDGKKAHIRITGLGDGVWADGKKAEVGSAIGKAVRRAFDDLSDENRSEISAIEFCQFGRPKTYCLAFLGGSESVDEINGVRIISSDANFSHQLPSEQKKSGEKDTVLCVNFAWDGGSYVGNEYWDDQLSASGDPAAACCSSIAISMNPELNPQFLERLQVVQKDGRIVGVEAALVAQASVLEFGDLVPASPSPPPPPPAAALTPPPPPLPTSASNSSSSAESASVGVYQFPKATVDDSEIVEDQPLKTLKDQAEKILKGEEYDGEILNFSIANRTKDLEVGFIPIGVGNDYEAGLKIRLESFSSGAEGKLFIPLKPTGNRLGSSVLRDHLALICIEKSFNDVRPKITYIDPIGDGEEQDIPKFIMDAMKAAFLPQPRRSSSAAGDLEIVYSTTVIQSKENNAPTNNHCGAFVAHIAGELASGGLRINTVASAVIEENLAKSGEVDQWQNAERTKEKSDALGKELRNQDAAAAAQYLFERYVEIDKDKKAWESEINSCKNLAKKAGAVIDDTAFGALTPPPATGHTEVSSSPPIFQQPEGLGNISEGPQDIIANSVVSPEIITSSPDFGHQARISPNPHPSQSGYNSKTEARKIQYEAAWESGFTFNNKQFGALSKLIGLTDIAGRPRASEISNNEDAFKNLTQGDKVVLVEVCRKLVNDQASALSEEDRERLTAEFAKYDKPTKFRIGKDPVEREVVKFLFEYYSNETRKGNLKTEIQDYNKTKAEKVSQVKEIFAPGASPEPVSGENLKDRFKEIFNHQQR